MGQRRRADQRGVGGEGVQRRGQVGVGGAHQPQVQRFLPAGGGAVHPGEPDGPVDAADEPGAAFAHGAEADDQKFHTNNPFCVSVAAPRSGQRPAGAGSKAGTGPS